MPTPQYILAIDLGTSGPKVALVAADGRLAARAVRAVPTQTIPPHGSEQDADLIWQAVLSAAQEVLHTADVPRSAVHGIICDSHYFSLIPLQEWYLSHHHQQY